MVDDRGGVQPEVEALVQPVDDRLHDPWRCLHQSRDLRREQLPEGDQEDGREYRQHGEHEQRPEPTWPVPVVVQSAHDRVNRDAEQPGQQQQEQETAQRLPRPHEHHEHRDQHEHADSASSDPTRVEAHTNGGNVIYVLLRHEVTVPTLHAELW